MNNCYGSIELGNTYLKYELVATSVSNSWKFLYITRDSGAMREKADTYLFSQNQEWQKKTLFGQQLQLTTNNLVEMGNTDFLDFDIIIVIVFFTFLI